MFKNAKKIDLVSVLKEIGEEANEDDTCAELKNKLLESKEFKEDSEFVKDLLASLVEDRKIKEEQIKNEEARRYEEEARRYEENKIEEARRYEENKIAEARKHEIELEKIKIMQQTNDGINSARVFNSKENEISLDKLMKSVQMLTIPVPKRSDSWNLYFDSIERAFKHKGVPDEYKAEILLNLIGEKANNVLVYIKEEDLMDYNKVKKLILREYEPSPQVCLSNFRKAKRTSGETYMQFASRLRSTWDYYCKIRKVSDFDSLNDLIISDKMFQTLDHETASHLAIRQGEDWLKPQELAREIDLFYSAKGKSFEIDNERKQVHQYEAENDVNKYVPPPLRKEYSKNECTSYKRKCFVCSETSHLARECPVKRNMQNNYAGKELKTPREVKENSLTAMVNFVDLKADKVNASAHSLKKETILIDSQEVEAILDSGTEIPVIHPSFLPSGKKKASNTIRLVPAFGSNLEAQLYRMTISYKTSRSNVFTSTESLVAVTNKLNVPCLLPLQIYELLTKQQENKYSSCGTGVCEKMTVENTDEVRETSFSNFEVKCERKEVKEDKISLEEKRIKEKQRVKMTANFPDEASFRKEQNTHSSKRVGRSSKLNVNKDDETIPLTSCLHSSLDPPSAFEPTVIITHPQIDFYQLLYGSLVAVMLVVSLIIGYFCNKVSTLLHGNSLPKVFPSPFSILWFKVTDCDRISTCLAREVNKSDNNLTTGIGVFLHKCDLVFSHWVRGKLTNVDALSQLPIDENCVRHNS